MRRKSIKKRSLTWVLIVAMLVTVLPMTIVKDVRATISTTDFINNPNWRNGAPYGYNQTPKSGSVAGQGIGCNAYVRDYIYQVHGGTLYNCGTRFSNANEIKAGDVVYASAGNAGSVHWFVVIGRNGNSLNVAEGNYNGGYAHVQDNRFTLSGVQLQFRQNGKIVYHKFEYGYHFGNVSVPQTVVKGSVKAIWADKYDTNMVCKAKVYNPGRKRISICGIQIRDGNTIIGKKEEAFYPTNQYVSEGDIWYDLTSELGLKLRPGHVYGWQIYADVNGERCYTDWINDKTTGTEKPNAPAFSTAKTNYAVGDAVTVSWGADANAIEGYTLTISQINGGSYSQTLSTNSSNATSLAFTLPSAGEYKITGYARGSENSDISTLNKTIVAHNPSKVRFVEIDKEDKENLLCEQTVRYGYSATAPTNPTRKGHTFTGWQGEFSNVTSDRTIIAQFKRNTYKIIFTDKDGKEIKTESVLFEDDATAPEPPEAEKGYVFAGWDSEDYKNVQGNATIKATYVWANDDLPVVITLNSCEFKEDGYIVSYDIKNNPNKRTKGRALVALKTTKGKLLDTTESKAFSLGKAEEKKGVEIYCPYEGTATVVDLCIVNGYSKGIPISEIESREIEREWSDWSPEKPDEGKDVETRKEYRTKDLLTTTTRTENNEGWTFDKKVLDSDWTFGNWSGWARANYSGSETTTNKREVQVQNVSDNNGYVWNTYYYYKDPYRLDFSYWNEGGNWCYYEFSQRNTDSPQMKYYRDYNGQHMYRVNDNNYGYGVNFDSEVWFLKSSTSVPATTHQEMRYRDGIKGYTYFWSKWGDWSDWTTTESVENEKKQVESRDSYRFRASMEEIENNSGKSYSIEGKVDKSLAGKQATLLVYKNDEPSDSNNEFVGQTVISADGGYSFSFIPKQEISEKTGDYSVCLAIEGAENPVFLKTIVAPKPKYKVSFLNDDGSVIDTQLVTEGCSATSPKVKNKEHYTFVGWDYGFTNVKDDMLITAQYVKNKHSVAYVNWETKEAETEVFSYGDPITYPKETAIKGYEFVGWKTIDGKEIETVTDNTVLQATYKIKTYRVKFFDNAGNVVSDQTVEYGKDALEPDYEEIDQMVFKGWSSYAFNQVESDVDVHPIYEWIETTGNPTCDTKSGVYKEKKTVHLSAEEGATIYYTTDGSLPTRSSNKYEEKIEISKNTPLRYIAVSPKKNVSETQLVSFLIASGEDDDGALVVKKEQYNLDRGKSAKITYFLSHENQDIGVNFNSLDENIASVDEDGNVHANNVGTTQIFISTKDNKYADYCDVIVTTKEIDAESIVLNQNSIVGMKNDTVKLSATVYPENTTDKQIDWYVDDVSIATVDEEGEVTFLKKGVTKLMAYSKNGSCVAECQVNSVSEYDQYELKIMPSICTINKGEYDYVWVSYGGSEVGCTFESCNEDIAKVDSDGKVSGISVGITTIIARFSDGQEVYSNVWVRENQISDNNLLQKEISKSDTTKSAKEIQKKQNISTIKIKTYKASKLKKKSISFTLKAKTSGDGKLTYKVTKGKSKYIKVTKKGKVTLKKKCKKGTYKIKITASKTAKYYAASKVVKIKVK